MGLLLVFIIVIIIFIENKLLINKMMMLRKFINLKKVKIFNDNKVNFNGQEYSIYKTKKK